MTKEIQKRSDYPKQKEVVKAKKTHKLDGIMGVLQLFVVVSIAYSSYIVIAGTDGLVPKLLVIPQILWAVIILVMKFTK